MDYPTLPMGTPWRVQVGDAVLWDTFVEKLLSRKPLVGHSCVMLSWKAPVWTTLVEHLV